MTKEQFDFYLDSRTGVSAYMQLVHQVRRGLRAGLLREGDQLPTVKEVVDHLVISPNTVLKGYRELEREGLIDTRPGVGTFVLETLKGPAPAVREAVRGKLLRWIREAEEAGFDDEDIEALIAVTRRQRRVRGAA
jgi:GntR family transcriptional regulator